MTTVNLSDDLVEKAKKYGAVFHRSTPKQIEYWATIGRACEDNPDLPFEFIRDVLLALDDAKEGHIEPYVFGWQNN